MTENKKSAVALGSFDGLHKGHMSVIACALSKKECGLVPVVLLFESHPLKILTGKAPAELLSPSARNEILHKAGIESHFINFEKIRDYSPGEFFEKIIIGELNAGAVCCGDNYRFGKNGSGNCGDLQKLCEDNSVMFDCVGLVNYGGSPVSSTRIRAAISEGNIADANAMLGREFSYKTEVVDGKKRGRLLDAPTINQYFEPGFIIPKAGVYASVTTVDGREYPSVTNIGLRPTFENEDFRSETYIIGFEGNLYGRFIEVKLIKYLREEIRFSSEQALKDQIAADAGESAAVFGKRGADIV